MSTSASALLRERGAASWAAAVSHPMVAEIGAGTLPHGDGLVDLIRHADVGGEDCCPAAFGPLIEKMRQLNPAGPAIAEAPTANLRPPRVSVVLT